MSKTSTVAFGIWLTGAGLLVLVAGASGAETYRWNVPGEGSWHDPSNWDPSTGYPDSPDTAVVDQGEAQITAADAAALKLWIAPTAGSTGGVQVDAGRSLVLYSTESDQGLRVGQAGCG